MSENINRALHELFAADDRLYLLGEDVLDPYGGAFRVTKGLSTAFGDRVLTTPLSENGIAGVAAGLALAGNRSIVEVMFGDFLLLALDQLINFATKSVSMYGRPVPLSMVVRCPVGGHRGYGPTHSQNLQKHLIGVPNLALYEISPLHDAVELLRAALHRGAPSVLFEDKVLYTQRRYASDRIDDDYRYGHLPGPGHWMRVAPDGAESTDLVLICPGGMVTRTLAAARRLNAETAMSCSLLVPGQLYPLELDPVLPLLTGGAMIAVAEEGTRGGTWGAELASELYPRLWGSLSRPIVLISSADSVIPAAPHLERQVLVGPETIVTAVTDALRGPSRRVSPPPVAEAVAPSGTAANSVTDALGHDLVIPTLNTNDVSCTLVDWLVADGAAVAVGDLIATVETSKATTDIEAEHAGRLRRTREIGEEVGFGERIGVILAAAVEADRFDPVDRGGAASGTTADTAREAETAA
ncbi:MAG TPA: transketolase C-terminal domain-containing protein, partial [Micromonosporaceae bacterium]